MRQLHQHVGGCLPLIRRIASMTVGVMMMLCAGTLYNFSIYAPAVKDIMKFNQFQIGSIGVAGSFGNYLGILIGVFFDRFGGKTTAVASGSLLFCGYGLFAAGVSGLYPSYWFVFAIFMFMIGQGNHGSYTASLMTNVRNFRRVHRGKVVGSLATCYGISGALFSQVYLLVFGGNEGVVAFLFFTATTLLLVNLFGVFCLSVTPPSDGGDEKARSVTEGGGLDLEMVQLPSATVVSSAAENGGDRTIEGESAENTDVESFQSTVSITEEDDQASEALVSPLCMNQFGLSQRVEGGEAHDIKLQRRETERAEGEGTAETIVGGQSTAIMRSKSDLQLSKRPASPGEGQEQEPLWYDSNIGGGKEGEEEEDGGERECRQVPDDAEADIEGEDEHREQLSCFQNAVQLWSSQSYLFVFCLFFVGGGTGLMFFTQVGSQLKSLGGTDTDKIITVTILSLGNALGRLVNGLMSDLLRAKVPRVMWLLVCLLTMGCSFVVLSFASNLWVIFGCAFLIGFPYGGLQSLLPTLISLLFSVKHFGQNWGWLVLAPAFGSFAFNMLASLLYDRQATMNEENEVHCYGTQCFMVAYLISAGCCYFMLVLSAAFLFATRRGRKLREY